MTQGTGSRHCTVSSGEHKVEGCSITARLSPSTDLSSHSLSLLQGLRYPHSYIPRGSSRERTYNCMRTRSQGRRLGSLLVSTWPGAEARHPQPSALCDPEAFPLPAAPAAGLKCRAKQLPLGVSKTRSSSHAGQPESVSPDTFLWPQPERVGFT